MSQRIKPVNPAKTPSQSSHWLAIFLIAFGVFLAGLNRLPVPTVDGAVRAAMARSIIEDQKLWPITYEGRIFTDHPPLYLWLTAASYKLFGITDFAANLVPHLFAFLTVITTALIAVESGMSLGATLVAVIVLCSSRDFVLSSVRGYIEPVLEFFTYLGILLALRQRGRTSYTMAATAGVAIWFAFFSKGPVALWPLLLIAPLLWFQERSQKHRQRSVIAYLAAFFAMTVVWAIWVTARGDWSYWKSYFFGQVLSSALEGRGGAQTRELTFFLKILAKFYWPWFPLLIAAIVQGVRRSLKKDYSDDLIFSGLFLITALGFVGGFSLMKWKFWYYIAPAYPALALFIANSLQDFYTDKFDRIIWARGFLVVSTVWILFVSAFPIELHRERVPEVMAFKDTIALSPLKGPVWYLRDPMDHNMIGTSGNWYFHRDVLKITETEEDVWARSRLTSPAWIITGSDFQKSCRVSWCTKSKLIQTAGKSALLIY